MPKKTTATRRKKRNNTTGRQETVVEDQKKSSDIEILEEVRQEWMLETREFPDNQEVASVSVSLGLTKNLGDYQSARIDVGITVPCLPGEVPEYYVRSLKWIEARIAKEVRRIDKDFANSGRRRR